MTTISVPFNIPNINITNINILDNDIIVKVENTIAGTCCKHCGQYLDKAHSLNKTIKLKHLPSFGNTVYIEFQPTRFQCFDCEGCPTTTEKLPWYQSSGHCTQLYAEYIINLLVNSTITDVAKQENITYKKVIGIINKHIPNEIDWSKINSIEYLGIDEISLKKGHKDFVVIISTKIQGKAVVLAVLKDRKKKTVKDFFGSKVKIVIDRFHVAKNYRGAIETLRKKEMKRLKSELSENEYKELKNVMWILRKQYSDLSDEEKEILQLLFKYSPLIKKAYNFRNKLTKIFNQPISKKQARRKINQWIRSVERSEITCFNTFLKTLRKLMGEILNYFINRLNSGFVEGLNNKIKVLKRRCYGIFNTENLFQRISIDLAGYHSSG
jgi:transposase